MTTTKTNTMTRAELVQRVRGRKGEPIGVLVAKGIGTQHGGIVGIGWSLCSVKMSKNARENGKTPDRFNFELGKNIARVRAEDPWKYLSPTKFPQSISKALKEFGNRARKYFKGHVVVDTVVDVERYHSKI